jgi:hypothetical protein
MSTMDAADPAVTFSVRQPVEDRDAPGRLLGAGPAPGSLDA